MLLCPANRIKSTVTASLEPLSDRVRFKYLVFLQGENNVIEGIPTEQYQSDIYKFSEALYQEGLDKFFMIRINHTSKALSMCWKTFPHSFLHHLRHHSAPAECNDNHPPYRFRRKRKAPLMLFKERQSCDLFCKCLL